MDGVGWKRPLVDGSYGLARRMKKVIPHWKAQGMWGIVWPYSEW